jgi:hypothetical protein
LRHEEDSASKNDDSGDDRFGRFSVRRGEVKTRASERREQPQTLAQAPTTALSRATKNGDDPARVPHRSRAGSLLWQSSNDLLDLLRRSGFLDRARALGVLAKRQRTT